MWSPAGRGSFRNTGNRVDLHAVAGSGCCQPGATRVHLSLPLAVLPSDCEHCVPTGPHGDNPATTRLAICEVGVGDPLTPNFEPGDTAVWRGQVRGRWPSRGSPAQVNATAESGRGLFVRIE